MKHPPSTVWVSFCTRCGIPILASKSRNVRTSCPTCPAAADPVVKLARYRLETAPGREVAQPGWKR